MSHDTPRLRCEIRRPPPELGWLKWSMAATIVVASLVDALWLVPAQREQQRRPPAPDLVFVRCADDVPAAAVVERRVDGIWLVGPDGR